MSSLTSQDNQSASPTFVVWCVGACQARQDHKFTERKNRSAGEGCAKGWWAHWYRQAHREDCAVTGLAHQRVWKGRCTDVQGEDQGIFLAFILPEDSDILPDECWKIATSDAHSYLELEYHDSWQKDSEYARLTGRRVLEDHPLR